MPKIILARDNGYADRIRKYRVLIDNQDVGKIASGETAKYEVNAGRHTLQVKIDWCRTECLAITMDQQDQIFNVKSNLRGWNIILAGWYAFFPSKWIVLERG